MRLRTVLVVGLVAATVLVNPLRAEPATPNPYSVKLGMAQGPNQRAFSLAAACGRRGRRRDLDAPSPSPGRTSRRHAGCSPGRPRTSRWRTPGPRA